jgi:hypothetical protein
MQKIDIEYNSSKETIKYPEYGRGIQELLEHACTIEDPRKRQKTVESIVHMMQMLNPNRTGVEDYRERLWNHAFAIAGHKLDVKPPSGVTIRSEEDRPKAQPVPYPQPNLRFRHYGSSVQKLMEKAIEMPEGSKKEGFVEVIASYMKLAYKTWSKEHYVSDDIVKEDLVHLSEGKLELHEGHNSLDTLSNEALRKEREMMRQMGGSQRGGRKRGGRKRGGSGGGNNGGGGNSNNGRNNGGGGNNNGGGGGQRRRRR